ncbi:hypothetical protein CC1G_10207 [Coprinopsis cinerea okayama7|uniref:DUF6533 domain-containing protein n=1 Tax=Coprinopsis cinerea (strain Okayama-7 / 130 / ATCC MYA-4618 / FGSC 9003) TaxID=240176 RepID=A8PGG1_COPC7|nr:hypothetical protein CC1G_10207 [Coprinopsis cinerea okayama7\|eukprot:XP_001841210.2 hypothetical protein CC1G_10207 [Coprinopsis cinerea okayama7\
MSRADDFMKMKAQLESTQLNIIVSASMTLLFAEYFQTLRLEVALVWSVHWGIVKIVYFINRFLPFVVIPFTFYWEQFRGPTITAGEPERLAAPYQRSDQKKLCKIIFSIPCIGIAMCILISEVILYVRVYALAGRGRLMLTFMIVHGLAVFVASISLLGKYVVLGSWGQSQFADIVPGCVGKFTTNGELVMIAYVVLLYSGFVVMILCVYFGLRIYWRSRRSPLIKIFYRDGTFYFVVLAVMSIANGVSAQFLPARYRFLMAPPQAVMHSTLSIRMILHLRETARMEMGFRGGGIAVERGLPQVSGTPKANDPQNLTFR